MKFVCRRCGEGQRAVFVCATDRPVAVAYVPFVTQRYNRVGCVLVLLTVIAHNEVFAATFR